MSFRLLPKSVTLDDLERRNSYIRSVISQGVTPSESDKVRHSVSLGKI